MTNTWKFSSVGLTNVIPLPEGGGPYTVGLDKAGGTYTGQLYYSPNLDASPLDDSWKTLTDLNTADESGIVLDSTLIKAVMGSITVRPTPVVDKGISAPVAKFEISVATSEPKGVQNQRRHGSGYGSNLIGGAAPVQDEYAALVLADMGVTVGSFFEMQDGITSPVTDTGPAGVTDFIDASGVTVVEGPWEGTKAHNGQATMSYVSTATPMNLAASVEETFECWVQVDILPAGTNIAEMASGTVGGLCVLGLRGVTDGSVFFARGTSNAADDLADPGAWLVSTVYAVGDRVRAVADNSRVAECTIGGTSDGTTEPVWPTDGSTVVDATVTWEDCGTRNEFHDWNQNPEISANGRINRLNSTTAAVVGAWNHLALVRTSTAWELYVNGIKEAEHILANLTGAAGTPARMAHAISFAGTTYRAGNSAGGSEGLRGALAYEAVYNKALTPAQILAHYNKGVALGL